ncbi:MAG: acyloxyacyl hydrolase [Terracidiphilus sp.]
MTYPPSCPRSKRVFFNFIRMLVLVASIPGGIACAQSSDKPLPPETSKVAAQPSGQPPASANQPAAELPDAPDVALETAAAPEKDYSSSLAGGIDSPSPEPSTGLGVSPGEINHVPLSECPDDETHARECRVHWHQLIITSSVFNAFQNAGNLYTGYWYRYETTTGAWFQRWFNSDLGWRWEQWSDGNPFLDDYIGHPMMGSITNYMWIQNDPKGMTVDFGNNREYWNSRLRATLFSTAYSFEWKFGPFGEAGVGHNGDHTTDVVNGQLQNDTGDVELVTTPLGGLGWNVAEDILDKYVVQKFEARPHGTFALVAISFLTPSRATANIFRFRPPWYRDGRQVKSSNYFSDPPGTYEEGENSQPASETATATTPASGEPGLVQPARAAQLLPEWPHYGGVHEFGAWWGVSLMTGHIWGSAKDIKYMPVDVTYSYLLSEHPKWSFRYAPELTALAMLDQPNPEAGPPTKYDQSLRQRIYGSGISPVGFRASFYPDSRVQPFLSTDGGFIYFAQRVLSPEGSQFMYTIDYGCGLTFFRKRRQTVSIGYRYQHLSNGDISMHNPGTDANTFYVSVSRFRTRGYR